MDDEAGGDDWMSLQSDVAVHDAGGKDKEVDSDGGDAEEGKDGVVALGSHAPVCDE